LWKTININRDKLAEIEIIAEKQAVIRPREKSSGYLPAFFVGLKPWNAVGLKPSAKADGTLVSLIGFVNFV
jgi:hypothetical protein